MSTIKPFSAYRPIPEKAKDIASLPYDVLNSEEARLLAKDNTYSFLHVIKPEIHFPSGYDPYKSEVYEKGKNVFQQWVTEGVFFQDHAAFFYVYQLEMNGRTQTGLVALASVEDYEKGVIKIHELTRPQKEEDRKQHIKSLGMHAEPVFFSYKAVPEIDEMIKVTTQGSPLYHFEADDHVQHTIWSISEPEIIDQIQFLFQSKVPATYVADGHHRTAAAASVGKELSLSRNRSDSDSDHNFFLAVHFPHDQLTIMDYNRVIKDLNGLSTSAFIEALKKDFDLHSRDQLAYQPGKLHHFGMYLDGMWFELVAKSHTYDPSDPIRVLDVNVLTEFILKPILGITDLRRDERIDFVGGIRGMKELERRVNSGEMKVAFSLFPVSMDQLIAIADQEMIMPPKTTWFEPKLRSGLLIHTFNDVR